MEQTRVRFAPSPTGFFHIGSARTALFNWLYARHTEGVFVLRIEDTDASRNEERYLQLIYDSLRWLGLNWDEGPEVGGGFGPYFQSQRRNLHHEFLKRLKVAGRTYEREGALWFRLEGERQLVFDDYRKAEIEKVIAPPVVIDDLVRGRVERVEETDFVLVRANGEPVFHFVNVVDDITMGITHVIRGEDHLSNTSKHVLLYEALGVPPPHFAHIPLILKDPKLGKGKMSKRDRGALIEEYQQRGFQPAALRNFLALLGWNPGDDREIMDVEEIIAAFSLEKINKDNARFDEQKLAFFNAHYVRSLPVSTLAWQAKPRLVEAGMVSEDFDEDYFQRVLELVRDKLQGLEGLPDFLVYFFREDYPEDAKTGGKIRRQADNTQRLQEVREVLGGVEDWTTGNLSQAFEELAVAHGQEKPFPWFSVTRFAVSGVGGGPDLLPMLAILGKERVCSRLDRCLAGLAD
jgi:glutamyl-tRNA synthetase